MKARFTSPNSITIEAENEPERILLGALADQVMIWHMASSSHSCDLRPNTCTDIHLMARTKEEHKRAVIRSRRYQMAPWRRRLCERLFGKV